MVNLDQHADHEVEEVDKLTVKKGLTSNKPIILQTIALIVTIAGLAIGLAIAVEHRITTVEIKTAQETQLRVDRDKETLSAIQKLQDVTKTLSENQVRVVTLLDVIDKRHSLEDQRRVPSLLPPQADAKLVPIPNIKKR